MIEPTLLHYQGNGAFFYVGISNGQRHALTVVVYTDDDEVACLAALGNEWSFHIETEYLFRVLYFLDNLVHGLLTFYVDYCLFLI